MARKVVLVAAACLLGVSCAPSAPPASTPPVRADAPRPPGLRAKAQAGQACGASTPCGERLACHHQRCIPAVCAWVFSCVPKLHMGPAGGGEAGAKALGRGLAEMRESPRRSDCVTKLRTIARTFAGRPWYWKQRCGAPPHPSVRRPPRDPPPFRILSRGIKAATVPDSAPAALRKAHAAHPDVCRAHVELRLTRPYQGWAVARVYEQYDCTEESRARRKRNPALPLDCKTRPYARTARRYIRYRPAGTRLHLDFYFSTPPEVCLRAKVTTKRYPTGCFCLGLDEGRVSLTPVEDLFLFGTPIPPPKPGPRPPAAGPRRAQSLDSLFD